MNKIEYEIYKEKSKQQLMYGIDHGYITLYNEELIERLRAVYYGGIPASILLLTNSLTNGFCYDRALLLSRAFLRDTDQVKLIYASVDSLRFNPEVDLNSDLPYDHCFVETIEDGMHYIYDTSSGFKYNKDYYWMMENPIIRHENSKEEIKEYVEQDPQSNINDSLSSYFILPFIEKQYGLNGEMYSKKGIELLQREVEIFKKKINYKEEKATKLK